MTKLRIDEQIVRVFPDVLIGVVRFAQINNHGENAEVTAGLRKEETRIRERFNVQAIVEHPHIAPWREAYRKFGAKPKDYPSSIENLLRRVLKGNDAPHINLLVDIYNTISLRHIIPVGGEDLDKIQGNVRLMFASDREPPVRLLGEPEARPPKSGEVIYTDDAGAICRRWNWKEADRTKFTEDTLCGFLIVEALPPVDRPLLQLTLQELVGQVLSCCGGNANTEIADRQNLEITLNC